MSFNDFYIKNLKEVVRYLTFKLKNVEEAEDLAQNIFMKLYTNWDNIDVAKASPRTYLFRCVKNSLIDYYRVKRITNPMSISDTEISVEQDDHIETQVTLQSNSNPIQTLIGNEYAENFKSVIRSLPLLQKRCAILYIHGFKIREIAEKLDTTSGTICPMIKFLRVKFQKSYDQLV